MTNEDGIWFGIYDPTGDDAFAEGFARVDGGKAKLECAGKLSGHLGYEVKPEHVRMVWVSPAPMIPKTNWGALKGLVGGGDRP